MVLCFSSKENGIKSGTCCNSSGDDATNTWTCGSGFGLDRGWMNFEEHNVKRLYYLWQTVEMCI